MGKSWIQSNSKYSRCNGKHVKILITQNMSILSSSIRWVYYYSHGGFNNIGCFWNLSSGVTHHCWLSNTKITTSTTTNTRRNTRTLQKTCIVLHLWRFPFLNIWNEKSGYVYFVKWNRFDIFGYFISVVRLIGICDDNTDTNKW